MANRVCTSCKDELPLTSEYFTKAPKGLGGLSAKCKICQQIYYLKNKERLLLKQDLWRVNNKDKRNKYLEENKDKITEVRRKWAVKRASTKRTQHLFRTYGIEEIELSDKMNKQSGCCEICGNTLIDRSGSNNFCVDHNHTTGEVRGLLCKKCNTALGMLEESIESANMLIKYIEKYNGK